MINISFCKLDRSFETPHMLHQIILQLVMSIGVSNLLLLGEKSSKCGRHMVISIYKMTHPFI
jgi:hypothetical protein